MSRSSICRPESSGRDTRGDVKLRHVAASVDVRTVVLVEGMSDQRALEALAERRGRNLAAEGVSIVPMGGATAVGRYLERFGPKGLDLRLAGLCDAGEERKFRRGLERAGLGSDLTRPRWKRSVSTCASPTSRTS